MSTATTGPGAGHGHFAWADLMSPDTADACDFYGSLLDWVPTSLPDHPASNYTLFTLDGARVAGLVPMSPQMQEQGVPSRWVSYILVDDVDAVAGRVEGLGGRVHLPPMDVVDSGRMALIEDPSGGSVALWQANRHRGADRLHDRGCMTWNELLTRNPGAACAFFAALLGWSYRTIETPQGSYELAMLDGERVGGIMAMPSQVPGEVPPHWDVYFAVDDVDEVAGRARALGGAVPMPPMTIPVGRLALVADRAGATFTIYRASEGS
ncbi:VOC family protein [Gemmatimonadota bacterium Y43]|uniref:VOC family protein n=1 Tax=Gaopeijia maritima TaxID=3119007 RepID=UPI00327546D2